jgi:hypothetical protein
MHDALPRALLGSAMIGANALSATCISTTFLALLSAYVSNMGWIARAPLMDWIQK